MSGQQNAISSGKTGKMLSKSGVATKQSQMSQQDKISEMINKGRGKIKAKEFNEAIKIFTEVLEKMDKAHPDAIFYRAISYLDQGNLQQAISELWRVVELEKQSMFA